MLWLDCSPAHLKLKHCFSSCVQMPLTQSCSQVQSPSDQNTLSYANYSVFNMSCFGGCVERSLYSLLSKKLINSLIIFLPFCFIEPFKTSVPYPYTASNSKHSNRSLITKAMFTWDQFQMGPI